MSLSFDDYQVTLDLINHGLLSLEVGPAVLYLGY